MHSHSQSVSQLDFDESREFDVSATPSRRSTIGKGEDGASGIPLPSGLPRRRSGTLAMSGSRRTSADTFNGEKGDMKPPARPRKLTESLGETY